MIYGYCTVSGKDEARQQEKAILETYPDAKMLYEGVDFSTDRTLTLIEHIPGVVSQNDVLVFDSICRMSRDSDECYWIYTYLFNKGRTLVFLKGPYLNTSVYQNAFDQIKESKRYEELEKAIFVILKEQLRVSLAYAEEQFQKRSSRRKAGIEKARQEGKQIGQKTGAKLHVKKKAAIKEGIRENARTFGGTMTDTECMAHLHVSYHTYKKYKQEIEEEMRLKKK